MAVMQYPIAEKYAKSWGPWEMVREVMQNAMDEHDRGFPMSLVYSDGKLLVRNEGASIRPEALLLGGTDKDTDSAMRGTHGEGLKLAMLVAAREGRKFKVLLPGETWVPSLQVAAGTENIKVLALTKRKCRGDATGVSVEVEITPDEWGQIRTRFLASHECQSPAGESVPLGRLARFTAWAGSVLSTPGSIYVKGIWVQDLQDLPWGFDLKNAKIDRDRALLEPFQLRYEMGNVLASIATRSGTEVVSFMDEVLDAMLAGCTDVIEAVSYFPGGPMSKLLVARWTERFPEAVPVLTIPDANEVARYNRPSKIVPNQKVINILQAGGIETLPDLLKSLWSEVSEEIPISDIFPPVRDRLLRMFDRVQYVSGFEVHPELHIVTFISKETLGLWKKEADGSRIYLNVGLLDEPEKLFTTLVHEMAHHYSGMEDNTADFEHVLQGLWFALYVDGFPWTHLSKKGA